MLVVYVLKEAMQTPNIQMFYLLEKSYLMLENKNWDESKREKMSLLL